MLLADSAAQALDQLGETIDRVLLDLMLPDVSDLSRLGEIKGQLPHCPLNLMKAHGDPDLFREAENGGAFRILEKPFGLDSIANSMVRVGPSARQSEPACLPAPRPCPPVSQA